MSINPAPFSANLFLYSFNLSILNNFYHLDPTKVYKYRVSRFIDAFSAISNDKDFLTSFEKFNRKEPELKIEHQENHTSSLSNRKNVILLKLIFKKEKFPFSVLRMPHLASDILPTVFNGSSFQNFFA